jgi:hypothetical protein
MDKSHGSSDRVPALQALSSNPSPTKKQKRYLY